MTSRRNRPMHTNLACASDNRAARPRGPWPWAPARRRAFAATLDTALSEATRVRRMTRRALAVYEAANDKARATADALAEEQEAQESGTSTDPDHGRVLADELDADLEEVDQALRVLRCCDRMLAPPRPRPSQHVRRRLPSMSRCRGRSRRTRAVRAVASKAATADPDGSSGDAARLAGSQLAVAR